MARFLGLHLLIMIPLLLLSSSPSSQAVARKFDVGGKDGWVVKPSENYNHWAQRNRFHVNDTLHFKYEKGSDSVLVVNNKDYDSCNTNSPLMKMDDGDSTFVFDNSGHFFFISGNADNCKNGQKLVVAVMAVRHKIRPIHPAPAVLPSPEVPAGMPPQKTVPSSLASQAPSQSSGLVGVCMSLGVGVGMIVFAVLV